MKEHKKMYKSGKKWVITTLLGAMTLTAVTTPSDLSFFKNTTDVQAKDVTPDQEKANYAYATISNAYSNVEAYSAEINSDMSLLAKNNINDATANQYASYASNSENNFFNSDNFNSAKSLTSEADSTVDSDTAARDAESTYQLAQSFSNELNGMSYDAYAVNKATFIALNEASTSNASSTMTASSNASSSTTLSSANTDNADLELYRSKTNSAQSVVNDYYSKVNSYQNAIDNNMSILSRAGMQNSTASSYASDAANFEDVFYSNNGYNATHVASLAAETANTNDLSAAVRNASQATSEEQSLAPFVSMLSNAAYGVNKAITEMQISSANSSSNVISFGTHSSDSSTTSSSSSSSTASNSDSSNTSSSANTSSSNANNTNVTNHQTNAQAKRNLKKAKQNFNKAQKTEKKAQRWFKKNEWRKHSNRKIFNKARKAYLKAKQNLVKAKKAVQKAEQQFNKAN